MSAAGARRQDRLRAWWDREAPSFDSRVAATERWAFRDTRPWIAGRATGATLEVAIGTGANLPHYPAGVQLSGVDFSPGMLALARRRAGTLGRDIDLRVADARQLPFPDATFDTVVSTFSLCSIPDTPAAVAEAVRVLRPGGRLLLADHVASTWPPVLLVQAVAEVVSIPTMGEHWRRRPLRHVRAAGLTVEEHDRFLAGMIERLVARTPHPPPP